MSRGLNIQEVVELNKYIQENNSWESMYEILYVNKKRHRKIIKYYTMQFDTRTNEMWRITFYNIFGDPKIPHSGEISFRTENGYDLKERIYNWLNEEDEVRGE